MAQEIEIEFKNMLKQEEYEHLINDYESDGKKTKQTNYYFDTNQMQLKENKCALRIRRKGNYYVLTLKEPHPDGLLETHQDISEAQFKDAHSTGNIPNDGEVVDRIKAILGTTNFHMSFLGELTTERVEVSIPEGLLVFDKSWYLSVVDYEMEFECTDRQVGEAFFLKFLKKHDIPVRKTENKIMRFYNEKVRESYKK